MNDELNQGFLPEDVDNELTADEAAASLAFATNMAEGLFMGHMQAQQETPIASETSKMGQGEEMGREMGEDTMMGEKPPEKGKMGEEKMEKEEHEEGMESMMSSMKDEMRGMMERMKDEILSEMKKMDKDGTRND